MGEGLRRMARFVFLLAARSIASGRASSWASWVLCNACSLRVQNGAEMSECYEVRTSSRFMISMPSIARSFWVGDPLHDDDMRITRRDFHAGLDATVPTGVPAKPTALCDA